MHTRDISQAASQKMPAMSFLFRRLTVADLPSFAGMVGKKTLPRYRENFARGDLCHGAFEGDRLVGFGWTSLKGGFDERTGLRIDLGPGEAYVYHFLVNPEYRGQDIGPALGLVNDAYLATQGVVRTLLVASFRNYAAGRAIQSVNTRAVKMIYLLRILGKNFQFERRLRG